MWIIAKNIDSRDILNHPLWYNGLLKDHLFVAFNVSELLAEERKMVEEVVKSENEAQYETMRGIGNEVFAPKNSGKWQLF